MAAERGGVKPPLQSFGHLQCRRGVRSPRISGRLAAGRIRQNRPCPHRALASPRVLDHTLRAQVVTTHGLARQEDLAITPQAALHLLHQQIAVGVVREATGCAVWRAFSTP